MTWVDSVITSWIYSSWDWLVFLKKQLVKIWWSLIKHENRQITMTSFARTEEGNFLFYIQEDLTKEGENGGQVPWRAESILSFHDNLTEVSRRWTIRSCHHVDSILIWRRCSSSQLTLCCVLTVEWRSTCGRTCVIRFLGEDIMEKQENEEKR